MSTSNKKKAKMKSKKTPFRKKLGRRFLFVLSLIWLPLIILIIIMPIRRDIPLKEKLIGLWEVEMDLLRGEEK